MNQNRLADLTRAMSGVPSRRGLLRLLSAVVFGAGSLTLAGADAAGAERRRKKKKRKPKQRAPTCADGRQNGAETDVDCGGTCPRCGLDKTCASRNDCTTALCVDSACAEPANPEDCGQDIDGSNCATRTNAADLKICTKIDGRFFPSGTCQQHCLGAEQCVLPVSGGVECVLPCGTPTA